jgi:hypothetical protein
VEGIFIGEFSKKRKRKLSREMARIWMRGE